MRLEWRDYVWPDGGPDADPDEPMPLAYELLDLDVDVSRVRPAAQDTARRQGSVLQWLTDLKGGFEGIALGKVVGVFTDPDEAKNAVEAAVREAHAKGTNVVSTRKSSKSEPATDPKPYPTADEFEEVEDDFKAPDLSQFEAPKGRRGKSAVEKIEDSIIGLAEAVPGAEVSFEGPDGKISSVTKAAEAIKARRASEAKSAKKEPSPIEKLAADLAEQLGRVVNSVSDNFAPKFEATPDAEYPALDGEVKRERRSLTTKLSREEVEASGHELAETVQKLAVVENLLDILRSGLRPTEKALTSRENALSGLVLRRERLDTVLCAHVLNYDASEVQIIRLDTGAIIDRRKPKPGEGQTRIGGL